MKLRGSLLVLVSALGLLSACDGASPSGQATTTSAAADSSAPAASGTGAAASATPSGTASAAPAALVFDKARSLPENAKFSDLVRVAREAAATPTSGSCLLQGGKGGAAAVLAAPLDKPAAKLVDPPADLDALFASGKTKKPFSDFGTRILTPTGYSEGGDYLDLVTFTPASRLATGQVVPILVATDRGLYIALPNTVSDGHLLDEADKERARKEILPKAQIWVVTAEGDAPISRVREALSLIRETTGAVVLASPLPKASKPKKRKSRYDAKVEKGQPYACSDKAQAGIEGGPIGSYDDKTVFALGDKFKAAVAACTSAGDGGSIHVNMRIAPDGKLVEACAETDDTSDPDARKCVVEAARKMEYPKPDKAGFVNFGTAAVLSGKRIAALCDP
ncbi:MAG: hypothetical protein U0441_32655 [Polyangiaceae bacterium]